MSFDSLPEIASLTRTAEHVFIATADPEGFPHITLAEKISLISDHEISVTGWFCPVTESNLARNPKAAVIVWDRKSDRGFQITGRRSREEDIAIMDGYAPGLDETVSIPQVERELIIRMERISNFSRTQHNDQEKAVT
jgi:hypothetical protein